MSRREAECIKYTISEQIVAGAALFQGRSEKMEDFHKVIANINNSRVSLFGIFDGHAGTFAAEYASNVILPHISEIIAEVLSLVNSKISATKKPNKNSKKKELISEEVQRNLEILAEIEQNPLSVYITSENKIDYENLLRDEIIKSDDVLIERMSKAALFCGSTCCIVVVDIDNKQIVCANVGDSRAIMCDIKGNAVELSKDHKPNNPEELRRIKENGGNVTQKEGCWRVEGSLATSRALGDFQFKQKKKIIIAEPDITTLKFKDFK
jgi:protein phosphatase 1L